MTPGSILNQPTIALENRDILQLPFESLGLKNRKAAKVLRTSLRSYPHAQAQLAKPVSSASAWGTVVFGSLYFLAKVSSSSSLFV